MTKKVKKTDARLVQEPVAKILLTMTLGMIVGHLSMSIFNVTDTYFVSLLGTSALVAMSFTFPVIMLLNSVSFGLGVGASSVISLAIGEGDHNKVQRMTSASLILAFIVAGFFSLIGLAFCEKIFLLLGAQGQVLELIKNYMYIWLLAFPLNAIPMVGNNAIRATGDARTPAIIMTLVFLLNAVLDPVLIFGLVGFPKMGVAGAALATVFSRIVSVAASVIILKVRLNMFDFHIDSILGYWRKILNIAIPASFTQTLFPLSMGVITRMVVLLGDPAVAAIGVGSRIDMIAAVPLMSLGSVLLPFAGQNFGARAFERIKQAQFISMRFCLAWGLFMVISFFFAAPWLAAFFTQDPLVLRDVATYLRIIPTSYAFVGVAILTCNQFNALQMPLRSVFFNLLRLIFLAIPFVYIGLLLLGFKGIVLGMALANVVGGVIPFIDFQKVIADYVKK